VKTYYRVKRVVMAVIEKDEEVDTPSLIFQVILKVTFPNSATDIQVHFVSELPGRYPNASNLGFTSDTKVEILKVYQFAYAGCKELGDLKDADFTLFYEIGHVHQKAALPDNAPPGGGLI